MDITNNLEKRKVIRLGGRVLRVGMHFAPCLSREHLNIDILTALPLLSSLTELS